MLETISALVAVGTSTLGLTKSATETAQSLKALFDKPEVDATATKQLISDLLDRLISLQTAQIAMHGTIRDLEQEQRRVEKFEADAVRYALTKTEQGALVYELKPEHAQTEPPHCICATCYQKQVKSILQPVARNTLGCHVCGGKFFKPDGQGSGILVGRVRRPDFDGFI
ncbi:hypothetical protein ACTTAF_06340 [Rhodobacter capsulatus]|uniref:hypothetical protein n=1 Tax=Rhodobacter capsulatus TaxID=1061 RepID=UPI0003D337E6|nr:hypothetical protein [Rhodobacter capsulatus]ETD85757.1 hypothetical protein U703_02280 [Rhodobacter capsulatus YW1]